MYWFIYCSQHRLQGMKHFRQDGMQKQLNIILLPCHAMWRHVLLQLFVFAIVLLHIKPRARLLMLLQIVAWLLLLMEIILRFSSKLIWSTSFLDINLLKKKLLGAFDIWWRLNSVHSNVLIVLNTQVCNLRWNRQHIYH